MTGHPLIDQLIISFNGILKLHASLAQLFNRTVNIVGGESQVLDAFAIVFADELLDLRVLVLTFVQRDADGAVGGDHRLAEQGGLLALDVEVLLFFEAEHLIVET